MAKFQRTINLEQKYIIILDAWLKQNNKPLSVEEIINKLLKEKAEELKDELEDDSYLDVGE